MEIRLNKLIADAGIASRRAADRLIAEGQVTVNGKKVYELGIKVDPNKDTVLVDGKPIRRAAQKIYLLFNKPKGVITSMEDPAGRPTVADYLEKVPYRVFPVGRLDWDSEGLLLLTNDGELANKVMNPKSEITKTYLVKLNGQPRPDQIQKLLQGVSIVGGRVSAKHIEKIKRAEGSDQYDWYKIVITEGKNRQIRQMFEKIGFDVMKLQRVAIGCLRLGAVPRGDVVFLHESSLDQIFKADLPDEVKLKKTYKGRSALTTATGPKKGARPKKAQFDPKTAGFVQKKSRKNSKQQAYADANEFQAPLKTLSKKRDSENSELNSEYKSRLKPNLNMTAKTKKKASNQKTAARDYFDNLPSESEIKKKSGRKK